MGRKPRSTLIPIALLLAAAALAPCTARTGPRSDLVSSYRAAVAQRVRVARILTEVTLGIVEHALDAHAVSER
ncbi:MAG: hypothetical protein H6694_04250 [Candidatus Latescibacteria bacterium]|nr:hypothetical protein [bacterium]MCB9513508.1 hypothetical protein [Candidatus Latescibacterota bacterium]